MGSCYCNNLIIIEQIEEITIQEPPRQEFEPEPQCSILDIQIPQLVVNIRTWQKESFSLFDYESNEFIRTQIFNITEEGIFISQNNEIFWQPGHRKENDGDGLLLKLELNQLDFNLVNLRFVSHQNENNQQISEIKQDEEFSNQPDPQQQISENQSVIYIPEQKFFFQNNFQFHTKLTEQGSKIWIVVKSIQQKNKLNGVRLMEGDHIKLGRVKLFVKHIKTHIDQLFYEQEKQSKMFAICSESQNSIVSQESISCRVCLSTSQSYTNPLISPCRCSGSMKYIHLLCLMKWLKKRSHSHCTESCLILIWKKLECELCKFIYPPIFKSDDRIYDLVELSKPQNQKYIMCEIYEGKQKGHSYAPNLSSGVYFILFNKRNTLRIGRAQNVEIIINDISVSRLHAQIKLIGNNVYINDEKSKFGTLLLLQKSINLTHHLEGLEIQVSRSLISFNLKQNDSKNIEFEELEKLLGRDRLQQQLS